MTTTSTRYGDAADPASRARRPDTVGVTRRDGVDLLVLPGATLGGYVPDLQRPWTAAPARGPDVHDLPPAFALDADVVDECADGHQGGHVHG